MRVKYLDYVFVYCLCSQTDSFYEFGVEGRIWLICDVTVVKVHANGFSGF